ncbi:hypothetical protein Dda_4186 [Drechslerella dactyloides]|uniref:Uncharacterized protein n=1 Tax=Drechslerella dactyloides TaxID=74499 RepID=A0AAD6IZR0_DREDA|nr:hypothetical protein Dda_4186 [Drechslerella dactyloides]
MVSVKVSALLLLPALVLADSSFTMDKNGGPLVPKIPTGNKDAACTEAYKQPITCESAIMMNMDPKDKSHPPDEKSLDKLCTPKCLSSLQSWIRGKGACDSAKFLDFLGISNSTADKQYSDSDLEQFFINEVYWDKCLTELNLKYGSSKYCAVQAAEAYSGKAGAKIPTNFDPNDAETFCGATTCGAQSAYLWAPKKIINKVAGGKKTTKRDGGHKPAKKPPVKSTETKGELISLKDACPKIDTSRFPKREEANKAGGAAATDSAAKGGKTGAAAANGTAVAKTTGAGAAAAAKTGTAAARGAEKTGGAAVSTNVAQQVSMVERSVAISALLVAVAFTLW